MIDLSHLKSLAKDEVLRELINAIEQQAQSKQFTETSETPTTVTVGKGEFRVYGDKVYFKNSAGTLYSITMTEE